MGVVGEHKRRWTEIQFGGDIFVIALVEVVVGPVFFGGGGVERGVKLAIHSINYALFA